MVTPPHGGGGGVATPSSVGSEPAPPDEAAAVLAAIAAASLHTLEPAHPRACMLVHFTECLHTCTCARNRALHTCILQASLQTLERRAALLERLDAPAKQAACL